MALSSTDIFPKNTTTTRILQPHKCIRFMTHPVMKSESDQRLIYRKKISKPYCRIQYTYTNIMHWEFMLLETFFHRMGGMYEQFYIVDWSNPYHITNVYEDQLQLDLDHIDYLDMPAVGEPNTTGYIGNKVIIYNSQATPVYAILTVVDIDGYTVTFDTGELLEAHENYSSKIYILYPSLSEGEALQAQEKGFCSERRLNYFSGFGNRYMWGPIVDVNLGFQSLGTFRT